MLEKYKVVHLARTPLVGAPGKVSKMLNRTGVVSSSYCVSDYPVKSGLNKRFTEETAVLSEMPEDYKKMVYDYDLMTADIIHIHNDLDKDSFDYVLKRAVNSRFIYQAHSPLKEGPLFSNRSESFGIPFSKKLVVAQYQPRHYTDFKIVPNLVLSKPYLKYREVGEKLRVVFSPSHNRSGRWNAKSSPVLVDILKSLSDVGKIDLIMPSKPVSPQELMLARRFSDVSIDEIVTGAYHQVSLEGLSAGNVVINAADYFSKSMLSSVSKSDSMPPFVYANSMNVFDVIAELVDDIDKTNELKKRSYDFFCDYLTPEKLIRRFLEVYEDVLK